MEKRRPLISNYSARQTMLTTFVTAHTFCASQDTLVSYGNETPENENARAPVIHLLDKPR